MKYLIISVVGSLACCLSPPDNCTKYYESRQWLFPEIISATFSTQVLDRWSDDGRKAVKLFTGDSIMQGWNLLTADKPGGYDWMTENNRTDTVNTAIVGNTTCDMIIRRHKHIDKFEALYIMTDGGGNDFKYGVTNKVIMQNLHEYLTSIRKGNPLARVVYGAIPPTLVPYANANNGPINEYVRQSVISEMGNACFIELYDFLAVSGAEGNAIKNEYSLDGIHFEPQVYVEYKSRVDQAFNVTPESILPGWLTCSNLAPLQSANPANTAR